MSSRSTAAGGLLVGFLLAGVSFLAGCHRGEISETSQGPTTEQLISFYSPRSIRVLPFTKPRSFDGDAIPDGLAVSLQPIDAAGDPVKAYGVFNFELFAYRNGAGDHRGDSIQTWTQPLASLEDQKKFWEHVTATYEFQLSWEGNPLQPQKKYILTVSFQAPGSKRLFAEYEFEFRIPREEMRGSLGARGNE